MATCALMLPPWRDCSAHRWRRGASRSVCKSCHGDIWSPTALSHRTRIASESWPALCPWRQALALELPQSGHCSSGNCHDGCMCQCKFSMPRVGRPGVCTQQQPEFTAAAQLLLHNKARSPSTAVDKDDRVTWKQAEAEGRCIVERDFETSWQSGPSLNLHPNLSGPHLNECKIVEPVTSKFRSQASAVIVQGSARISSRNLNSRPKSLLSTFQQLGSSRASQTPLRFGYSLGRCTRFTNPYQPSSPPNWQVSRRVLQACQTPKTCQTPSWAPAGLPEAYQGLSNNFPGCQRLTQAPLSKTASARA